MRTNPRTRECTIDWRDAAATRALTRAILLQRYRLDVLLPPDRLCPAVTGRANYIRFLHALLGRTQHEVWGVDVGTGAACIYALLGARLHGWHFVATDTDSTTLRIARDNVERNKLAHLIETRLVAPTHHHPHAQPEPTPATIAQSIVEERRFDFVMCNPPFFDAPERRGHPLRACPMTAGEASTPGGDAAFVMRMVDESTRVPRQCCWWSSLLGRKRSLRAVWDYLHGGCATMPTELRLVVREGELVQGRTTRWVIAWSFCAQPEQEQEQEQDETEKEEPKRKKARHEAQTEHKDEKKEEKKEQGKSERAE